MSGLGLERIADPEGRNGPIYANRVRALIHKMFNFAPARDYGIDFNACTGVERPGRDRARDRVLMRCGPPVCSWRDATRSVPFWRIRQRDKPAP